MPYALQLFGWMQHVMKKTPTCPPKTGGTLPPIIMVQWKMDVSPILVSFHFHFHYYRRTVKQKLLKICKSQTTGLSSQLFAQFLSLRKGEQLCGDCDTRWWFRIMKHLSQVRNDVGANIRKSLKPPPRTTSTLILDSCWPLHERLLILQRCISLHLHSHIVPEQKKTCRCRSLWGVCEYHFVAWRPSMYSWTCDIVVA